MGGTGKAPLTLQPTTHAKITGGLRPPPQEHTHPRPDQRRGLTETLEEDRRDAALGHKDPPPPPRAEVRVGFPARIMTDDTVVQLHTQHHSTH